MWEDQKEHNAKTDGAIDRVGKLEADFSQFRVQQTEEMSIHGKFLQDRNDNNDKRWEEQEKRDATTDGRLDKAEGDLRLLAGGMQNGQSALHQRYDKVEMRQKQLEIENDQIKMGQDQIRTEMKVVEGGNRGESETTNSVFKWHSVFKW